MAVSTRRLLEQLKNTVTEAESVVENKEDIRLAVDDLEQAEVLMNVIAKRLTEQGRCSKCKEPLIAHPSTDEYSMCSMCRLAVHHQQQ